MVTVFKNMRKYHNFIKNSIIQDYITKPSKLLDLAVGAGGDLGKWKRNKNIIYVEGYDINKTSIKEARRRLKLIKLDIPVKFYVKDLSRSQLFLQPFDVISIQFAFHYFFKNQDTLQTILNTININSKKGTLLLMTVLDSTLVKNISSEDLQVKKLDKNNFDVYNNELSVYIKYSVLDVPTIEYIVDPVFLIFKMKSIHFELKDTLSFSEFDSSSFELNSLEKKYSFMNRVYIFEKK